MKLTEHFKSCIEDEYVYLDGIIVHKKKQTPYFIDTVKGFSNKILLQNCKGVWEPSFSYENLDKTKVFMRPVSEYKKFTHIKDMLHRNVSRDRMMFILRTLNPRIVQSVGLIVSIKPRSNYFHIIVGNSTVYTVLLDGYVSTFSIISDVVAVTESIKDFYQLFKIALSNSKNIKIV